MSEQQYSIFIDRDVRHHDYTIKVGGDAPPPGVASAIVNEELLNRVLKARQEYIATQAILSDLFSLAYDKRY